MNIMIAAAPLTHNGIPESNFPAPSKPDVNIITLQNSDHKTGTENCEIRDSETSRERSVKVLYRNMEQNDIVRTFQYTGVPMNGSVVMGINTIPAKDTIITRMAVMCFRLYRQLANTSHVPLMRSFHEVRARMVK